jgi:arylsulfatase A-like enzyme/Flp pilus assembly protein TadD
MRGPVVAVGVVLAAAACSPPRPAPSTAARHLILVTIDTLRADRLGCYGSRDVTTPHLDRLASEGAMALHSTVHVPLTRPSHVSIFTGLYPAEHGIRDNVSPSLSPEVPTLAVVLKAAGFRTAAFVSSIVVSAQSGLGRGFDTYSDHFDVGGDDARFLNSLQKTGDVTMGEAVKWLESPAEGRRFAWIHLYDPHDPYEPPEPYASQYAGRPYDGEVAWSDDLVGRLDSALERLGLRGETLLVVTSDHGEGLGEHGESVHGFFVYESTLRVPLLVRGPGVAPGGRFAVTARSIDLFPTVLDLMAVPVPAGLHLSGRSLASALRGGPALPEEPAYAESLLPLLHYGWSDLRAVRDGRWKYIQAPRPELYDLQSDPGELRDMAAAEPGRAEALRAGLARRLEAERAAAPAAGAAGVPADLLEKLGALGYLGAGAPAAGSSASSADPKDKIGEYKVLNRLVREGLVRLREKDYRASEKRFRELLRRGVESFEVHYYLGRALVGQGRPRDAVPHFEAAVGRLPGFGAAHLALADCRIALGELRPALEALRRGQAQSPKDPRLLEREAQVWRRLGDRRQAIRAYEAAVALAPKDALLKVEVGEAYRDAGEPDRAIALLREAVALSPSTASYWNSLGMVLGAKGDLGDAEKAFREAVARDGRNAQYAYNLGLALLRQGRPEEATPVFQRTLELEPGFAAARARLAETRSGSLPRP